MRKILAIIVVLTLPLAANAASLTYVIQGTMDFTDPSSFLGNNFHGSRLTWKVTTDTDIDTTLISAGSDGGWLGSIGYDDGIVESVVTLTNRPNGLLDLTTTSYESGNTSYYFFLIENYLESSTGNVDRIVINASNRAKTDLFNLSLPDVSLFFDRDFFPGEGLPNLQGFSHGELIGFNASVSSSGDYTLTDVNVSSVPIPAAAWLFGSALLGLGVLERKTNSRSAVSC